MVKLFLVINIFIGKLNLKKKVFMKAQFEVAKLNLSDSKLYIQEDEFSETLNHKNVIENQITKKKSVLYKIKNKYYLRIPKYILKKKTRPIVRKINPILKPIKNRITPLLKSKRFRKIIFFLILTYLLRKMN